MRSYSPSSSYVLNVVAVGDEAVKVATLLFPPNVTIVSIDVFESVEGKPASSYSQTRQRGTAPCPIR
jgi:hypothetical protein